MTQHVGHVFILAGALAVTGSVGSVEASPRPVADSTSQLETIDGWTHVIVGVDTEYRPDGELKSDAEVAAQRARIVDAQDELVAALPARSYRVRARFRTIPYIALSLDSTGLEALETLTLATSVENDSLSKPHLAQSVPLVRAPSAWAAGFRGSGQVIAVLDTGVDSSHPFLAGSVVSEACYSANGNCPNGLTSQESFGAGQPCSYAPGACAHGTHVAGIAAGGTGGNRQRCRPGRRDHRHPGCSLDSRARLVPEARIRARFRLLRIRFADWSASSSSAVSSISEPPT